MMTQRVIRCRGKKVEVQGTWSLLYTINGTIAGMVAICAGADVVRPWAALVIGIVGALAFRTWSKALKALRIDDPLDAVGVHMGAGIWGVLARPLFQWDTGIVYTGSELAFKNFAWGIAGVCVIMVWTGVLT